MVYSEENYSTLDKLTTFSQGLMGSYLTLLILAVVVRKYIGLELAALFQLGYLSLLQNPQVSVYSQPILGWSFVFGYNGYYLSPLPSDNLKASPYAIYDYQKYFGFSNNVMVLITASIFGVAIALVLISMLTPW